ncbi:sushi, von Willebrand factor type A, EGF and pentraxin domain-containing protein 1-like [Lineus longissimus]|uniref:sushi, von Willebrand factor type A, EGF and pentraxin domain-containing protein 1-like n=1 Tax=Lineus longissimus TaxID=88925 RepID=UPI00315DF632
MEPSSALTLCEVSVQAFQYRACQTKRYGPNCNNRCQCANDDTCDDKTGQCPSGCKDFFTGPYCNIAITCDPPSRLLNGKVSTTFLATVGWFVSYKCDKGFVLEGKENSTCVENVYGPGNVADSTPVCRAITCDPPSLTNGQVSVPKPALLGSAVSYQCNTGYVLEGKESSTCVEVGTGNVKGSWADPTPVCTAITCDPPSLTNGRVSGPKPALLGSAVSYQCDTGYVLEGIGSSTCVEVGPGNVKGSWADPTPVCTAITCDQPSLTNGRVSGPKPALLGSAVSYQCDTGYVLEGKGSSTCVEDGTGNVKGSWADPKPACTAIICDPPSLTKGQVSVPRPALLGSAVSYQCDTGYVLEGKGRSTCVEDQPDNVKGSWADPTPVCTAITCDPPSLTNGQVSVPKPAHLGSAVSYQCDTGYVLEGKGSSTCVEVGTGNVKGSWADPAPVCTAICSVNHRL